MFDSNVSHINSAEKLTNYIKCLNIMSQSVTMCSDIMTDWDITGIEALGERKPPPSCSTRLTCKCNSALPTYRISRNSFLIPESVP